MKKKIILLAASALAILTLCGCGQRSAEENTPNTASPAENQPATPPAANPAATNSPAGMTNAPAPPGNK